MEVSISLKRVVINTRSLGDKTLIYTTTLRIKSTFPPVIPKLKRQPRSEYMDIIMSQSVLFFFPRESNAFYIKSTSNLDRHGWIKGTYKGPPPPLIEILCRCILDCLNEFRWNNSYCNSIQHNLCYPVVCFLCFICFIFSMA